MSLLLVTYIAVHRSRGVRNGRRHSERITSPENITNQKLTNVASGILVGTIFVNLVKLHRIEEICGECMATNRKCGQDMYITSMNLTMKSTKLGAEQLQ